MPAPIALSACNRLEHIAPVLEGLRSNPEAAASELFWGADSIEFLKDFLKNPSVVKNQEMQRLDGLPVAAARRTSG